MVQHEDESAGVDAVAVNVDVDRNTDPTASDTHTAQDQRLHADSNHNHTGPDSSSSSSSTKSNSKQKADTNNTSPSGPYPAFVLPPTLPRPPFIDVDGVANFRSLGNYPSSDGLWIVRPNIFYRCAHPMQISLSGLETLTTTLGVRAVYDLRSGPEAARTTASIVSASVSSGGLVPSVSARFQDIHIFNPVYAEENNDPEALARKLSWYTSSPTFFQELPYTYSEGFVNAYRDIALHGAPAYTTIFRHILQKPNEPFVFHCTAGKDRTGVLAALILRLAGVSDDMIVWDYALTEPGLGVWRDTFIARITAGGSVGPNGPDNRSDAKRMSREEAGRIVGARAPNMRAWVTLVLDGEFGGVERYLHEKCGFSEEEIEMIRKNVRVERKGDEEVVKECAVVGWTPEDGVIDS